MPEPHLFVDISAHGFGHLAQVAPVLDVLTAQLPGLRISIRSGLSKARLQARLLAPFSHLPGSSDFGYVMHDAMRVDLAATARAYRTQHADWHGQVDRETRFLNELQADLVLTDVAYLPLAGAARAGIPAVAMCSLNWAELFAHFFSANNWAATIHRQMLSAYNGADCFLRLTPGMAMADLSRLRTIAPVAALGKDCRQAVRAQLCCGADERLVLIAFGGVNQQLPVADWPQWSGVRWLVPQDWRVEGASVSAFEPLGRPLTDLLRCVDAVIAKPGYGTFTEAACNAAPVLYVQRENWPEQDCLIDWLQKHGSCGEISEQDLLAGHLRGALEALWQQPARQTIPLPVGAAEAAALLLPWLRHAPGRA